MAGRQVKRCSRCKQEKPLADFTRHSRSADGLRAACRECIKKREKEIRKNDPARFRAYLAKQRERDHEKLAEWKREYYEKNKARLLAKQKKYRAANKEKCNAAVRVWMQANRAHLAVYQATYRGGDQYKARAKIRLLKRRARKRGLPNAWSVDSAERAKDWFGNRCAVCEAPFGLFTKIHWDHWVSLTNPKCPGTVPTNMVPLCSTCNLQKLNRDAAAWLAFKFNPDEAARVQARIDRFFHFISGDPRNVVRKQAQPTRQQGRRQAAEGI
jgi:hypothetical protein